MESRSVYEYIWTGTALRYLVDVRAGTYAKDPENGGVIANIRALVEDIERFGFKTTAATSALEDLREIADKLDAEPGAQTVVDETQATDIVGLAVELRSTLDAESRITYAFVVRPKRYATEKLVGGVQTLMAEGCYNALPDIAQIDLTEAGRCIAFECPTAAAFHLMRAVEATLRDFYVDWVRSNRLKEPRLWAAMVGDMRKRSRRPPEAVLDALDYVRVHFRNPTQHPDVVYSVDEAQDLLNLAIDVINRMVANRRSE